MAKPNKKIKSLKCRCGYSEVSHKDKLFECKFNKCKQFVQKFNRDVADEIGSSIEDEVPNIEHVPQGYVSRLYSRTTKNGVAIYKLTNKERIWAIVKQTEDWFFMVKLKTILSEVKSGIEGTVDENLALLQRVENGEFDDDDEDGEYIRPIMNRISGIPIIEIYKDFKEDVLKVATW